MEKMKTLTIGGVTYAVCAPLTEEEKQEVTDRVLDGISYEEILAPHKQEIAVQAAQDVRDRLDVVTQELAADFVPGSINASGEVNTASPKFAVTAALVECTEADPVYVRQNTTENEKSSSLYLYFYGANGFIGLKGGLRFTEGIHDLTAFCTNKSELTHIRIAINYQSEKVEVTDENIATVLSEFTFTRDVVDPVVRKSQITPPKVKVMTLGDSITKEKGAEGWTTYFLEKINGEMIANVAVGGAVLADRTDVNTELWLSSQVDTIVNGDYDEPDIIMIAVGANLGISITPEDMDAAYYDGSGVIKLENVTKKTDAEAFRYASETLHKKYKDAVIFWCSPVHQSIDTKQAAKRPSAVRAWHESLRVATEYTGFQHIDTIHCGINSAFERVERKYDENGNMTLNVIASECLRDGLHPNAKGAKLIGYYNAAKVKAAIF